MTDTPKYEYQTPDYSGGSAALQELFARPRQERGDQWHAAVEVILIMHGIIDFDALLPPTMSGPEADEAISELAKLMCAQPRQALPGWVSIYRRTDGKLIFGNVHDTEEQARAAAVNHPSLVCIAPMSRFIEGEGIEPIR